MSRLTIKSRQDCNVLQVLILGMNRKRDLFVGILAFQEMSRDNNYLYREMKWPIRARVSD